MKQIMKHMAFWTGILCAGLAMVSCDEFPPIKYDNPDPYYVYTDADFPGVEFGTIAELKAMHSKDPVTFDSDYWIKAQVISSDQSGNLYRTMYIQDATGGIELKMGTRNLYNDYKLGQWVYVNCNGLTIGDYHGMIGLGYKYTPSEEDKYNPKYQTSYIDNQYIIDTHVFRGKIDTPVEPLLLDVSEVKEEEHLGKLVTIKNLIYKNEIFAIIYYDPDSDDSDRKFLSGTKYGNYGINTWAMSEKAFEAKLKDSSFDFNGGMTEEEKAKFVSPSACTISQYFNSNGVDIQVRTSGYARFADTAIDQRIIDGIPANLTGILTIYDGNYQFTLIDLNGVEVAE